MQNISLTDVVIASNRGAGISVGLKHLQCEKPSCRLKPDCMCPLSPPTVTITVDGAVIEGAARLPGLNDSATRKNVGIKLYAGGKPGGSRGFGVELLDEPNFLGTKEIGRGQRELDQYHDSPDFHVLHEGNCVSCTL